MLLPSSLFSAFLHAQRLTDKHGINGSECIMCVTFGSKATLSSFHWRQKLHNSMWPSSIPTARNPNYAADQNQPNLLCALQDKLCSSQEKYKGNVPLKFLLYFFSKRKFSYKTTSVSSKVETWTGNRFLSSCAQLRSKDTSAGVQVRSENSQKQLHIEDTIVSAI